MVGFPRSPLEITFQGNLSHSYFVRLMSGALRTLDQEKQANLSSTHLTEEDKEFLLKKTERILTELSSSSTSCCIIREYSNLFWTKETAAESELKATQHMLQKASKPQK
ncbi:Hypothetical predicted protein [Xyrichtys novacula]|uniref:Uncharacterized protein n=1 Tax=Xyrichtys novacula TaxID=13765 RepID=A0AAV1ELB2_XYRNO|nr:Hypothetical predicted protein [Xyrichtys novacula]